jgi:hypothetical protein
MVFIVTFNYISVRFIGGETVVPRENHRSAANHIRKMILCFILHWGRRDRMVV